MSKDLTTIRALDEALVNLIKGFQFLTPLGWPKEVQDTFLLGAKNKNYILPDFQYPKIDYSEHIATLQNYLKKLGKDDHPAITFLRNTAESYLTAYGVLQGVGTKAVNEHSQTLYGNPSQILPGYKRSNLSVAKYFLRVVNAYKFAVEPEPLIYSASQFKKILSKELVHTIDPKKDPIAITVDQKITARAAAGANYVKIRKDAYFSEADLLQLLHHEALTHTLTFINGRKQPTLKTLGYASPRTTATQEGLAVFAEYINNSIELVRLKRIALRIVAIHMAEEEANLIDLFKFFKKHGQNEEDSYYSSMRILRGGYPEGGIIFYKDNVYLQGLIEVEGFLKKSMHSGLIHDIAILFAGKMTTSDVATLHPLIDQNVIAEPAYIPVWAQRSSELASHLAFNDLTERFKIKES